MKSLTKRKSLMGFIYALVMLLPFSSILVRCLYVTFNKNAYQSYSVSQSADTYLSSEIVVSLETQHIYQFTTNIDLIANNSNSMYKVSQFIPINVPQIDLTKTVQQFQNYHSTSGWFIHIQYTDNTHTYSPYTNANNVVTNVIQFNFVPNNNYVSYDYTSWTKEVLFGEQQPLDNAFDYSLYTFLNENGSGQLNLTDWFTDIFLNRTTHNMLYLNYVNWYMNYSLLVSCVYLLYSVLMWFLTFARYVINKPLKESE